METKKGDGEHHMPKSVSVFSVISVISVLISSGYFAFWLVMKLNTAPLMRVASLGQPP